MELARMVRPSCRYSLSGCLETVDLGVFKRATYLFPPCHSFCFPGSISLLHSRLEFSLSHRGQGQWEVFLCQNTIEI